MLNAPSHTRKPTPLLTTDFLESLPQALVASYQTAEIERVDEPRRHVGRVEEPDGLHFGLRLTPAVSDTTFLASYAGGASTNDSRASALASALLLTEGDEEAIKIVEGLLKDKDKKIKVQAALVFAVWGKGEEAIAILERAYADADRMTKERILEGLGRIAAESSIPFLVEKLQETFELVFVEVGVFIQVDDVRFRLLVGHDISTL